MTSARWLFACVLLCSTSVVMAGPPYLTDDPVPTDPGKWEIYNFVSGEGRGSALDGAAGLDLNYGPVRDVQLTATLPAGVSHGDRASGGWRVGSGDLELGVKYRFVNREKAGFSAAIFPRIILPTAAYIPREKARFLLPVWFGEDFGNGTSVFGGGGFTINPGAGNRDYWQAGAAITRELSKKLSVGLELARQGADVEGNTAQTRLGLGSIIQLNNHEAVLLSGGPTWANHQTSYRFYAALGLFF